MKKYLNIFVKVIGLMFMLSAVSFTQWTRTTLPNGYYIQRTLVASREDLFISIDTCIFRSSDGGTSWGRIGVIRSSITTLAISTDNQGRRSIFVGTNGQGVFRSTNDGENWSEVNTGIQTGYIDYICTFDTILFVGTGLGSYVSKNNGVNWVSSTLPGHLSSFIISASALFASIIGSGVYKSTDQGASWAAFNTGLTDNNFVIYLVVSNNALIAGTVYGGVFRSADDGQTWLNVSSMGVSSLAVAPNGTIGNKVFAGTYNNGVFTSADNGTSWTPSNQGLSSNNIIALTVFGGYLFAQTGQGVWRRPISEFITSVNKTSSQLPEKIVLYQNYPNPFNPTTKISYQLSVTSHVSLKVHDMLGREVATLVNEQKLAGLYQVTFDAHALPSGMYFYRLQTNAISETKKCVLLR